MRRDDVRDRSRPPGDDIEVTATFTRAKPSQFPLTVSVSGSGRITSAPAGDRLRADVLGDFPADASVTLTAIPTPGLDVRRLGRRVPGDGRVHRDDGRARAP